MFGTALDAFGLTPEGFHERGRVEGLRRNPRASRIGRGPICPKTSLWTLGKPYIYKSPGEHGTTTLCRTGWMGPREGKVRIRTP